MINILTVTTTVVFEDKTTKTFVFPATSLKLNWKLDFIEGVNKENVLVNIPSGKIKLEIEGYPAVQAPDGSLSAIVAQEDIDVFKRLVRVETEG